MSDEAEKYVPIEKLSAASGANPSTLNPTLKLVSQDEFDKTRKILDWTFGFIVAVLAVCFTTFVVLTIDAWKFHSETIQENSKVIESLRNENEDLRFNSLSQRLDGIERFLATKHKSGFILVTNLPTKSTN